MRRAVVLVLFAFVLALGLLFETCGAQEIKPRFVLIDSLVRVRLAEEWDPDNRYQRERAYCLMVTVESGANFDTWRVHSVQRAHEPYATPSSVVPVCPDSTQVVLHVHPPSWCSDAVGNVCYLGGRNGYQCQPSPNDRNFLLKSRRTLDLIQCGPNQFLPMFRDGAGFF
jgi:hypothetical protein